jgi:AcrR family transcriptional regulator
MARFRDKAPGHGPAEPTPTARTRASGRGGGRPRTFTDDELLDTARRCFLEHGPAVSTSTIADALGVSQAAVFKRVATKQELMVRALTPRTMPSWIGKVLAGPDDRPVREQLRELAGDIDGFLTQLMPCISVLSSAGLRHEDMFAGFPVPPPVIAHRAFEAWFAALIESGRVRACAPAALATAFLGSMQGRRFMQHALGDRAPDSGPDYLDNLVELFWGGLDPERADTSSNPTSTP